MALARDLWLAYWGAFDKDGPSWKMPKALKDYWRTRAETGEVPVLKFPGPDFDPIAIASAHGARRKVEDPEGPWNLDGYLPPDPDHKTKIKPQEGRK